LRRASPALVLVFDEKPNLVETALLPPSPAQGAGDALLPERSLQALIFFMP